MTHSENALSRWSRLKQDHTRSAEPDSSSTAQKSIEVEPTDLNRAATVTPAIDSAASPAFDPASLPPLQSITVGTDIRSFLRSNVPAELTKAALRRAWATDPAVRDFIGIAENQWDFNDPTAMVGFGPLGDSDDVPRLLAQIPVTTEHGCGATTVDSRSISAAHQIDDIDHARAREYSLLAALLSRSPDAQMIEHLARLDGDTTPLGIAHGALSAAATGADPERIAREYFDLFIGLEHGKLLPYASYYLTGYLYGRPLARLRDILKKIGIERTAGQSEPEDHAAILFEVMAGLASGQIIAPAGTDRDIFEKHLKPWIGRFFADLERAKSATFYTCVGALGCVFMEIETEAFSHST